VEGRADPDNTIGKCISDVVGSLPKMPSSTFDKLVNDSLQVILILGFFCSGLL